MHLCFSNMQMMLQYENNQKNSTISNPTIPFIMELTWTTINAKAIWPTPRKRITVTMFKA